MVEVWHKLSRRSSTDVGGGCSSSAVFGRRLGPAISDVLLGYTEISLIQLLQKHSGKWLKKYSMCDYSLFNVLFILLLVQV